MIKETHKINVLHVTYIFDAGGIESFISQLVNNLNNSRIETNILVLSGKRCGMLSSIKDDRSVDLMIKDEIDRSIIGVLRTFKMLVKELKNRKPDIIHVHHEHYVSLFVYLANFIAGSPSKVLRTVHSGGGFYVNQRGLVDKLKLKIEQISLIFFPIYLSSVSSAVQIANVKYFGKSAKEIRCIPNGVDLKASNEMMHVNKNKGIFGWSDDDILVSYVARLNPGKNHEYLIKIWSKVSECFPKAKLVFAGDGPLLKQLSIKAVELGCDRNIVFLGQIDNVYDLLSISEISVFPSEYEGHSIAILEKMSMNLPVVASRIEAFTSIFTNEKDIIMVDLNNPVLYAEKIIELLKDPDQRAYIGNNARATAEFFSADKTFDAYESYYKYILCDN